MRSRRSTGCRACRSTTSTSRRSSARCCRRSRSWSRATPACSRATTSTSPRSTRRTPRPKPARGRPAITQPVLLGITKASLADPQLHLGGLVPGNHPRAHRRLGARQARHPGRPEGERHRRPPDPGGHGLLPARPAAHRRQARRSSWPPAAKFRWSWSPCRPRSPPRPKPRRWKPKADHDRPPRSKGVAGVSAHQGNVSPL